MSGTGKRRWRLVRARTDAVPASLRRFMSAGSSRSNQTRSAGANADRFEQARFTARARRRRMRLLLPGGLVSIVVMIAVVGGWLLWSSSVFGVRDVQVSGADLLSPSEVRAAAAVDKTTPLLRVDRTAVAEQVGTLAPVLKVEVHRSWPDTLVVEVVERTPVAVVPYGEAFQLLDREGVLFYSVSEQPGHLPALELSEPGPGDPATRAALQVLDALTPQLQDELATLTVTGPARIQLELASGRTVVWGDETDSEQKSQVATALLDGVVTGDEQVINVSAPEVVVLR